mgnify:CR=1 FL=1
MTEIWRHKVTARVGAAWWYSCKIAKLSECADLWSVIRCRRGEKSTTYVSFEHSIGKRTDPNEKP